MKLVRSPRLLNQNMPNFNASLTPLAIKHLVTTLVPADLLQISELVRDYWLGEEPVSIGISLKPDFNSMTNHSKEDI